MAADRGERRTDGPLGFATFIVRISHDDTESIGGVVEWVRTGERIRFHGLAAISEIIARMVERARKDHWPL